mgnify:CR=1 FL=1
MKNMENDTISRQAAKLKVARVIWEDGDSCYDFHDKCIDCLDDVPPVQPDQYIKEKSVDIGYLHDWYQNSVTDDSPVWTDEHIKEMFCDFYMIPIQGKEREENR